MEVAAGHSLSSCSSASMLVPVLGALLALSKSQFLYHSLGSGSFSGTAYSVPGVSQRSARGRKGFRGRQPLQNTLPACFNSGVVPFAESETQHLALVCDELQLCQRALSMYWMCAR